MRLLKDIATYVAYSQMNCISTKIKLLRSFFYAT